MLDTAIIGGGLCGLALANSLLARKVDFALFEARNRFGGRILSVPTALGGMLDLGATWYWPDMQPNITRLVADLALESIAQYDDGTVLHMHSPAEPAKRVAVADLHNAARRIKGGTAALISALVERLPADKLHLDYSVEQIVDRGDHVEIHMQAHEQLQIIFARRVVLAVPPRVLAESIRFDPPLATDLLAKMQRTPTWMASAAKAGLACERAFWRDAGHSGNALIAHEHATLTEVFDACEEETGHPALAGFLALDPVQRQTFESGLPMLLRSQFMHLYGPEGEQGDLHYFDWAKESLSCSEQDRSEGLPADHPQYGDPALIEGSWNARLLFGSAETAEQAGGYMEGALVAAARLGRQLSEKTTASMAALASQYGADNEAAVARFGAWVESQRQGALERYRQRLNQALAKQASQHVTEQALSDTVQSIYQDALATIGKLPFDSDGLPVERGRCALTPAVLSPFSGFNEALLGEAVRFNQTSCAMSNFPDEHKPNGDYVSSIRVRLNTAWHGFAYAVNDHLLARRGTSAGGQQAQ